METEKMKEIKKNLECCIAKCKNCEACTLENQHPFACVKELLKDLQSLINELEREKVEKIKQFVERLIEKKVRLGERFNIYDIDETLKESINE